MELEYLFENANQEFLKNHLYLLETDVSERTLCGAFMLELHKLLQKTKYQDYYVDVEYNRNSGGKIKTACKTITGGHLEIIKINCDLIVHSRGTHIDNDNLIAIEMKKSRASESAKQNDRKRLQALTKDTFDDVWSFDGRHLPKHVCRYQLGVYYEINYKKRIILIEYYKRGELRNSYEVYY